MYKPLYYLTHEKVLIMAHLQMENYSRILTVINLTPIWFTCIDTEWCQFYCTFFNYSEWCTIVGYHGPSLLYTEFSLHGKFTLPWQQLSFLGMGQHEPTKVGIVCSNFLLGSSWKEHWEQSRCHAGFAETQRLSDSAASNNNSRAVMSHSCKLLNVWKHWFRL